MLVTYGLHLLLITSLAKMTLSSKKNHPSKIAKLIGKVMMHGVVTICMFLPYVLLAIHPKERLDHNY